MADRICGLPDEIIHHILSFLLMKDAIKTSVLSKRWRHQWTFNPNLDFPFVSGRYSWQGNYEVSAINRCINVYNAKQLHRLHIDLNLRINPSKQIESWIDFAAKREVEQLNIVVRFDDYDIDFIVPASLFYSKSIRVLRMKSCIFRFPSDFKGFPFLKSLYLNRAKVDDCNSIQSLLSCCPCLQSLELLDCKYMKHLRIMNTLSLQRLFVSAAEKIEIFHAPNLQYFRCNSKELRALLLEDATSLMTVDVSSISFARGIWPAQVIREWNRFVVDVSHVKILSVNPSFVQLICAESYLKKKQRVVFKNLKRLNFDGRINDNFTLHALFDFFQDCPSLENVKIDVRFPWPLVDDNWISEFIEREREREILQHKLTCYLLYNLKNVRLNGFSGRAEEVRLVNVLFDKAAVLEKFFLSSCVPSSELLQMELASLPKRSPSARITVENGLRFNV